MGTSSRRSHNSIARIHQLEGKVDELVSLLGTTGGARRTSSGPFFPQHGSAALDDSSSSDPSAAEASDAASATAATGGVPSCMPGAGGVIIALDPAVAGNGARPGESPGPSLVTSLDPGLTDVEAQRYLDDFQANHLPHFPFLHLPDDCRALRAHRPFLFFCIMVAACPSIQRKMEWGDRVKRTLVDRVFLGRHPGVVTIDLLLGALVFLSWGRDYLLMGTPARVPRFAQLAMTLAYDMRLNKPPQEDSEVLPGGGQKTGPGLLPNQNQKSCFGTTRTMEERRAVLACFVTSSV